MTPAHPTQPAQLLAACKRKERVGEPSDTNTSKRRRLEAAVQRILEQQGGCSEAEIERRIAQIACRFSTSLGAVSNEHLMSLLWNVAAIEPMD